MGSSGRLHCRGVENARPDNDGPKSTKNARPDNAGPGIDCRL